MKDAQIPAMDGPIGTPLARHANPPHYILMVDDDKSTRNFCALALADHGYRVDTAEDGAAAWDVLQINTYNLLITDHGMPRMNGADLLKKLHDARMALPVIMATGTLPDAEFNQFPWLRPSAVLIKPYTTAELLKTVKEVLRATNGIREWIAPPAAWEGSQPPAFAGDDDSNARSIF
jgi:DNA-binding response OmpR family regulator